MQVTAKIEGWSIHQVTPKLRIATGYILDDVRQRWRNGTFIQTSAIINGPDENNIITTVNSVYQLGEPHVE